MRRSVLFVCLALAACGSALEGAKRDFEKGQYAQAKETLVRVEPESKTWDQRKRAEYALYRGLTHNALGDRSAAGVWLKEAKALEDARPGTLNADDQVRLRLGLEAAAPASAAP